MPVATAVSANEGKFEIEAEVDLNSSGAITAVRGTNITALKTGTGTYQINYLNRTGIKMYEILSRQSDLVGTPATAFWSKITNVQQLAATNPADTAPDSGGDVVISVTLLSNAATPAAADTTGACTITVGLTFRATRMSNPF